MKSLKLQADHPAIVNSGTVYPATVYPIEHYEFNVIKPSKNKKLGKLVTKGRYKGMPIYTVTLPERKTCPDSCSFWSSCYGNRMPYAHRIDPTNDPDLFIDTIKHEVSYLAYKHRHTGFLVRLHVLGDFFSLKYLQMWWHLQTKSFPNVLKVFGFSARLPQKSRKRPHTIGDELLHIQKQRNKDFFIRFSGLIKDDVWSANSINESEEGIICPYQLGLTENCGTCGLCWTTDKPILWLNCED